MAQAARRVLVIPKAQRQQQRRERAHNGDHDRERHECRVVFDATGNAYGCHPRVVHPRDASAHEEATCPQHRNPYLGSADDEQRQQGRENGDSNGEQPDRDVIGDWNREVEGQHPDEMHAPDSDAHRDASACQPRPLVPSQWPR